MSRGVTRDLSIRAQEQLEKQERLVERLEGKLDVMYRETEQAQVELAAENEILTYYRNHPALKDNKTFDEIVLPLEMK